jgi:hypothetical protein
MTTIPLKTDSFNGYIRPIDDSPSPVWFRIFEVKDGVHTFAGDIIIDKGKWVANMGWEDRADELGDLIQAWYE